MTAFDVKPSALDTYAGVLRSGGHEIDLSTTFSVTALGFVNSYSDIPADDGDLFYEIYKANQNVYQHLQEVMPHIGSLCLASGAALVSSASTYRESDRQAAAAADAAYGEQSGVTALTDPPSRAAGLVDPKPILSRVPDDDVPIPDMVHWVIDKSGWLSITGVALKIASLFGFEPVKDLTQAVVGDYSELAQAGNAAEILADFERQAAYTVSQGLAAMTSEWSGNAADSATTWFNEFANALHAHADELDEISVKYVHLAQACDQIAEVLEGALSAAIDNLLCCAAALAAAGCLASVPGINVLIGLIGAYQVWRTKDSILLFVKYTGAVTNVVESFLGLTLFISSAFRDGGVENRFPSAPYANNALPA